MRQGQATERVMTTFYSKLSTDLLKRRLAELSGDELQLGPKEALMKSVIVRILSRRFDA